MFIPFIFPYVLFILVYGSVDQHYKIENAKEKALAAEKAKEDLEQPTEEGESHE